MGLKDEDAPHSQQLICGDHPTQVRQSWVSSGLTHLVELRLLSFNLPSQGLNCVNCRSCLSQLTQQLLLLRLTLQVPRKALFLSSFLGPGTA